MRVVAGEFRGRRLIAPEGTTTRPTTDRAREAVFNSLTSMGLIDDATIADVFAGSGALGIEALSRGAQHCTFVERDRRALDALRKNIDVLGLAHRSTIVAGDALAAVTRLGAVDVVFADPPYDFADWSALLAAVPSSFVVAESGRSLDVPNGWAVSREKRYGRAIVSFVERAVTEGGDSGDRDAAGPSP